MSSTDEQINKLGKLSQSARATITECHTLGSLDNRTLLLIVLEAGNTDQGISRFGFSGSLSAQLAHGCLLTVSTHGPFSVDTPKNNFKRGHRNAFHRGIT